MSAIIVDGAHFLSKVATGIGSYARTLVKALRTATERSTDGKTVSVLYGQRVTLHKTDLELALQLFGNEPAAHPWTRSLRKTSLVVTTILGRHRRVNATPISLRGLSLSSHEPPIPVSDVTLNSDRIYERAAARFAIKERFLEFMPPEDVLAAHWTVPMPIKAVGVPNIYTIHDVIPLQYPHFVIDRGGRAARLHREVVKAADLIIAVSEATKRDIVDVLGVPEDRIAVTYTPSLPIEPIPREAAERLVAAVYGVKPGAYALFVGAIEPRKNIRRMIEAHLLAGIDMPLILAGPLGWLYDSDMALIETIACQPTMIRHDGRTSGTTRAANGRAEHPWVRHLGYLPQRHITALMQCARFFIFPSIHEGFGLPVLEALQLGVPVITSNTSSLPEVVGDAAIQINPLDVTAMAREITRMANDADVREHLSKHGPIQAARYNEANYQVRLAAAYAKLGIIL